MIIHFLGGIHELYFPYVLMKPLTIIAMIAGGMSGTGCLTYWTVVWWLAQVRVYLCLHGTDAERLFPATIAGVTVGTPVSFAITSLILKMEKNGGNEERR